MDLGDITPAQVIAGEVQLLSSYNEDAMQPFLICVVSELYKDLYETGYQGPGLKHDLSDPGDVFKDSEFVTQANNVFEFMINNVDPIRMCSTLKVMLSTYNLPVKPKHVERFDEFHEKLMSGFANPEGGDRQEMMCEHLKEYENSGQARIDLESADCVKYAGWNTPS